MRLVYIIIIVFFYPLWQQRHSMKCRRAVREKSVSSNRGHVKIKSINFLEKKDRGEIHVFEGLRPTHFPSLLPPWHYGSRRALTSLSRSLLLHSSLLATFDLHSRLPDILLDIIEPSQPWSSFPPGLPV